MAARELTLEESAVLDVSCGCDADEPVEATATDRALVELRYCSLDLEREETVSEGDDNVTYAYYRLEATPLGRDAQAIRKRYKL